MMASSQIDPLADAFFGALEAGSVEDVNACFAPGARLWHNFDRIARTPEENVAGLETLFTGFPKRSYVDVRRLPTAQGWVQQHVLRLERADGAVVDWPGCIVFDVAEGKITRLDEYVDIASLSGGG
jgi:ketosteroid isomerase-like protein